MTICTEKTMMVKDGRTITLKTPTADEAQRLIDYLDQIRRETENVVYSPSDALPSIEEEQKWISNQRENTNAFCVGAYVGDEVIGLANISHQKFAKTRHVATLGISVLKAWWGLGIGTILMHELEPWARQVPHVTKMALCVYAFNEPAIALYKKCGFIIEGRLIRHVRLSDGSYGDVIEMGKSLD